MGGAAGFAALVDVARAKAGALGAEAVGELEAEGAVEVGEEGFAFAGGVENPVTVHADDGGLVGDCLGLEDDQDLAIGEVDRIGGDEEGD